MPSSAIRQINEITELIYFTNPDKILDIGIGCGKYGFLSREYLDQPYGEEKRRITVHGAEAFEEYLTPLHKLIYDKIFLGDFLDNKEQIDEDYDLVLMIDVIEHFDKKVGLELIDFLLERSRNLIIATPDGFIEQEEVYGNEYEIHRSGWAPRDFKGISEKFIINHDAQLIVYLGGDADRVKQTFKSNIKYVALKRMFPFVKRPYRKLKSIFS